MRIVVAADQHQIAVGQMRVGKVRVKSCATLPLKLLCAVENKRELILSLHSGLRM